MFIDKDTISSIEMMTEEVEKKYGKFVDKAANDMHEKVVDEVKQKIKEAYINAQTSGTVQGTDN